MLYNNPQRVMNFFTTHETVTMAQGFITYVESDFTTVRYLSSRFDNLLTQYSPYRYKVSVVMDNYYFDALLRHDIALLKWCT